MKLPTVNQFLCCFELETGGLIVGYFAAIVGVLASLSMVGLIILGIMGSTNTYDFYNIDGSVSTVNDGLKIASIVLIVVCAIMLIYFLILTYAAVQLIRGTKNRNHVQCKLYLTMMGIGCILSFLQIFTAGVSGIAGALISTCISIYFFICIYSMYQKFKEEKVQKQQQPQPYYA